METKGTKLFIPIYQQPDHQFLYNSGEVYVGKEDGPAVTLWELLLHLSDLEYPLLLGNKSYSKGDLLFIASEQLTNKKETIIRFVGEDGYNKLFDLCVKQGLDPNAY